MAVTVAAAEARQQPVAFCKLPWPLKTQRPGAAIGSAMVGMRPIVDLTIASFLYVAMDQIVSMAAKTTYMYGEGTRGRGTNA